MRPKEVVFFIPSFGGGGAERQCAHLINALSRTQEVNLSLIYFHKGVNFRLLEPSNLSVYQVPVQSNYDPRIIWHLSKIVRRIKPDIVFSWLHASDVYTWILRLFGVKFKWIMAERDSWYPLDPRYLIRRLAGRYADVIVANSLKGIHYWTDFGVSQSNCRLVSNILPETWLLPRKQERRKLICYAGRFEHQKNVATIAKAFAILSMRRPEFHYLLAGQGTMLPEIQQHATKGAAGRIHILPFQENVEELFNNTSIFVNFSYHEGQPNSVIENMAIGNRLVLSLIPEHVELVGPNYPFLLEVTTNASHLADVIEEAMGHEVSISEHREFLEKLAPMKSENVASQYVSIFHEAT